MSSAPYPPERIADLTLTVQSADMVRIFDRKYRDNPLGTGPGDSRLCAKADNYHVLYASPDFTTSFLETVVRDRYARPKPAAERKLFYREISMRVSANLMVPNTESLNLLDLRGDGCVRLGVGTDAIRAEDHGEGRTLGRNLHDDPANLDGILFSSRLTGQDVYAIFDRATNKLIAETARELSDDMRLPEILDRYGITLIRS